MNRIVEPLVSIIMPTYNHGEFIAEAVDSVIAQTYANWELIIVNNYSTDNTDEVLSRYTDARIRTERYRNGGIIAKSRNRGLSLARGEYVAFLDSDDAWRNGKLEAQVRILQRHEDLLLCSTAIRIVPGGLRSPLLWKGSRCISLRGLSLSNIVYNSTVLLRTACLRAVGVLNESAALRAVEDYEYWLRILRYRDRSIFFLDSPLVLYRVTTSNASTFGKPIDRQTEWAKYEALAYSAVAEGNRQGFLRCKRSECARRYLETSILLGRGEYDRTEWRRLRCADLGKLVVAIILKTVMTRLRAASRSRRPPAHA